MNLTEYCYKTDLHVHTAPVSKCARIYTEEVIKSYSELGYSAVVITNHFHREVFDSKNSKEKCIEYYLSDYYYAKKLGEDIGMNVILGLEIKFPENSNEYMVYGIDETDVGRAFEYINSGYARFYQEFKNERNVIVQAHPFRNGMTLQKSELLDGIEVFNMHPGHNSRVAQAAQYAYEHPELIVTGGTDFHHENHQGMCAMKTRKPIKNSFELAEILKTGDYCFDIWGNIISLRERN